MRLHPEDKSWEIGQALLDFLVCKLGCLRTGGKYGKAGSGIASDFHPIATTLPRRKNNAPSLDFSIERITSLNPQPAPNRAGKHDLSFGRNLGLHGKTILPRFCMNV